MAGARWLRLSIQTCLLAGLLFCVDLVVRRGVGTLYFSKRSPDAIQTAMKWDPSNPQYYSALGTVMHLYADSEDSGDIIRLYQTATSLSPHEAQFWADLGAASDWAGRRQDAVVAFQRAHLLSPNSPEIHWRLANFYFRAGHSQEGLRALQKVLEGNSGLRKTAFELATRAAPDRNAILEQMLPQQTPILFDYLNFEVEKGDFPGAAQVWDRILQENLPFALRDAFPYLDALIQHREVDRLAEIWSMLAARFPSQIAPPVTASNLVTNGSFERDLLNGGLDWRVVPAEGAVVSLESAGTLDGTRSLRIAFAGSRNLEYGNVLQYVPVQPNTRYRFSGRMRVQGITTDSGPRFQICDAYDRNKVFVFTQDLVGSSAWSEQRADFTTNADSHLLLIRIVRPASTRFDNQISGTVWIDGVRLSAAPSDIGGAGSG